MKNYYIISMSCDGPLLRDETRVKDYPISDTTYSILSVINKRLQEDDNFPMSFLKFKINVDPFIISKNKFTTSRNDFNLIRNFEKLILFLQSNNRIKNTNEIETINMFKSVLYDVETIYINRAKTRFTK